MIFELSTTTLLCNTLLIILFPLAVWILRMNKIQKGGDLLLPPGPPKLPFIGNLHHLGPLPHRSLTELSQRYGPIMSLRFGSIPAVVISSADMAREVFKSQDRVFANRPVTLAARKFSYNCSDITFGEYGSGWKTRRKMVIQELLSTKKVQSFQSLRVEEVDLMIDMVTANLSNSSNNIINIEDLTLLLANSFVSRAAFGKRCDDAAAAGGRRNKFHEAIRDVQILLGGFCVADLFPSLTWFNKLNGFQAKVDKRFRELDQLYNNIIQEHSHRKPEHEQEEDLVDVLLRLQKDPNQEIALTHNQIKGVITDTFNAGTDTASATLVWIMAELMKNPSAMKKAQDEVRQAVKQLGKQKVEEDDLPKLTYLKAVIKEGFRLHPPLPLLVPRETIEDSVLMGYRIPAKTTVFVNALAIGTDPKIWASPNEFRPERFMDSPIDFKGLDFGLLPFGSGRRGCPGISFGILLIELALANLLFSFNWELPPGMKSQDVDMDEVYGLTIHKKIPLCLVATRINV